jgi:hypothetical protein
VRVVLGAMASKSALKKVLSKRASTGHAQRLDQVYRRSRRGSSSSDISWRAALNAAARGHQSCHYFFQRHRGLG